MEVGIIMFSMLYLENMSLSFTKLESIKRSSLQLTIYILVFSETKLPLDEALPG